MLTVTKHLPELQCFLTIILCRNVCVFCQRTVARGVGSEKEMCKKTKPNNRVLFIGTFQVIIKQVCYTTFSKKVCSKANMITFLFKKLNHQGVLCKKIMCKIYPCTDFKNRSYKNF